MQFSLSFLATATAAVDNRPNIMFIMLDDLGWSNVGFHNPMLKSTPFLDSMLRESEHAMELTNMYTQARCSPSRAAFLTGVYPYRFGMGAEPLKGTYLPEGLDVNLTLLPEIMKKEANYSTHMIGKWHLGHANDATLPQNRGFDTFYGFYEAQLDYFTHTQDNETTTHLYRDQNGPVDVSGEYMTIDLTREAKSTLLNNNQEQPKFIYLPYQAPHYPVSAPESVKNKLKTMYEEAGIPTNDKMLTFHAAINVIDQCIAELWEKSRALQRETLIIITTDNGGGGSEGGCNFPYRGKKQRFLEGGIKATTMVMSTRRSFTKRHDTDLMYVMDWFPTLLGIAGIDAPSQNGGFDLDGVDFSSRFGSGRPASAPRDRFIIGVAHELTNDNG